jgi:hypothetical protein
MARRNRSAQAFIISAKPFKATGSITIDGKPVEVTDRHDGSGMGSQRSPPIKSMDCSRCT